MFCDQDDVGSRLTQCFVIRMMWAAGSLASVSMITYPAISALVSCSAEADQQGQYNNLSSHPFATSHTKFGQNWQSRGTVASSMMS